MVQVAQAGMTRRRVVGAIATSAGLGALVAAGCGTTATTGTGGAAGTSGGAAPQATRFAKSVSIEYWTSLSGAALDAKTKLTDAFNTSRSDIKVNLVNAGGYDQGAEKFLSASASGTPPDGMLFTVDSYGRPFARMGLLASVDEFLKVDKAANVATYVPGLLKDGQVNGKQYQIPFARSTELLFTNKDHLKLAGLPETGPTKWTEVLDASQKIVRGGVLQPSSAKADEYQAFSALALWWAFQSMLWDFGGRYSDEQFNITIGDPPAVEAGQFLADMVNRSRVARAYKASGDARKDFVEGRLSLLIMSCAGLVQLEKDASFRVGAAFMPAQKAQAVHTGGSGLNLVNAAPREKKEAGWEYIKHLTTTDNTVSFAQATGYMPVRSDAVENASMKQFLQEHPNGRVTLDQAKYVHTVDEVATAPDAIKYIEAGLAKILIEQTPVKAAFDQVALDLKQAVAKVPGK